MGFCGNGCGGFDGIIWIIILLVLASSCNSGCNNGCGNGLNLLGDNSCGSIFILIILFWLFCGNNGNFLNNNNDCGCGCNTCS